MSAVPFVFALHAHQPVGNFGDVVARACDRAYDPLLAALERHPGVRFSLHVSGCLLEFWETLRPDLVRRVKALADRGQCELMGGWFYEPILPAIPRRDRLAQAQRSREDLRTRFGLREAPAAAWLPERVWEPGLAKDVAESGVRAVPLDDFHFLAAGLREEELAGHFLTEDEGKRVAVFPILQRLRYLIPFEPVASFREYVRGREGLLVFADDAEKFGEWPGTHDWVHAKGWLEAFLGYLEGSPEEVRTLHFREAMALPSRGRIYLPATSYAEMGEWALPAGEGARWAEAAKDPAFQKTLDAWRGRWQGGLWRNFLVKYPESNWLQKKAAMLSEEIDDAGRTALGDTAKLAQARRALHRAQCNCAYWHGVFGGIYLPWLRGAVHREAAKASALLDEALPSSPRQREGDLACDGTPLLWRRGKRWEYAVRPDGAFEELVYRPLAYDLADTLARRFEHYHPGLRESGAAHEASGGSIHHLKRTLKREADWTYDPFPRRPGRWMLLEHPRTAADLLAGAAPVPSDGWTLGPGGWDFLGEAREGAVLEVRREVLARRRMRGELVLEMTVNLGRADDPRHAFTPGKAGSPLPSGTRGRWEGTGFLRLRDENAGLEVLATVDPPGLLRSAPLETISQSEAGADLLHQGTILLWSWPLSLEAGDRREFRLSIEAIP